MTGQCLPPPAMSVYLMRWLNLLNFLFIFMFCKWSKRMKKWSQGTRLGWKHTFLLHLLSVFSPSFLWEVLNWGCQFLFPPHSSPLTHSFTSHHLPHPHPHIPPVSPVSLPWRICSLALTLQKVLGCHHQFLRTSTTELWVCGCVGVRVGGYVCVCIHWLEKLKWFVT